MSPTDIYFALKIYGTFALLLLLGLGLAFIFIIFILESIKEKYEKHRNKQIDEAYKDKEK